METAPSQEPIWSYFQNEATQSFAASIPRHRALLRTIRRLAHGASPTVLNVGIGNGNLETNVQALGWTACSLDPDAQAVDRLCEQGIEARKGFLEELPFADERFDFVVASEVLEHIPAPQREAGLGEVQRTLKPGGYLLGTVPYEENLDLSVTVCPHCRQVFHRWGHTSSFSLSQMRDELARFRVLACRRTAFVDFQGRSIPGKIKSLIRLVLAKVGAQIAVPSIFFLAQKP